MLINHHPVRFKSSEIFIVASDTCYICMDPAVNFYVCVLKLENC